MNDSLPLSLIMCTCICVGQMIRSRVSGPEGNAPVILLGNARNFFTGTRPTMHENLKSSLSVAERESHTFANLIG